MRKIVLSLIAVALIQSCVCSPAFADSAQQGSHPTRAVAPLFGEITREFDPPNENWEAGHRGVDIAGMIGDGIVASMEGIITFCGIVAGKPVVSISHGDVSTTYEPVSCTSAVGQRVGAGEVIGYLQSGHPCPVEACLHWGLKQAGKYLDPLSLLHSSKVRLMSAAALEQVRIKAANLPKYIANGHISSAGFVSPATGVITAAFGMRLHPITHMLRFHDGLDIGAGCGSPISAAVSGMVVSANYSPSYGNHLIISNSTISGHDVETGYAHALGFIVSSGDWVEQGQIVGFVGATGDATGCHLHFQVWKDSSFVDPAPLLR